MKALVWGVRASFVRYVLAQPDGRCDTHGVTVLDGEEFIFPSAEPADAADAADVLHFTGTVSFAAHGGALRLVVADPSLERLPGSDDGRQWGLMIADADGTGRACLAVLGGDDTAPSGRELRLTEEGAGLFGGYYRAGDALDPLVVTSVSIPA